MSSLNVLEQMFLVCVCVCVGGSAGGIKSVMLSTGSLAVQEQIRGMLCPGSPSSLWLHISLHRSLLRYDSHHTPCSSHASNPHPVMIFPVELSPFSCMEPQNTNTELACRPVGLNWFCLRAQILLGLYYLDITCNPCSLRKDINIFLSKINK